MVDAFTIIDLIAASTNAFVGALLARRPDHYRNFTRIGIVLLAIIGGIGGGVARDLILNDVPSAFTNPWYIILCTAAGIFALAISYRAGQKLKEGALTYMAAFSLPWYAAVGVNKALVTGLPEIAAIVIGIIGPTAGRFIIDTVSGVTPKHFVKGEFFVGTALLASVVYLICYLAGLSIWPATLISLAIGFAFRVIAQNRHWEEKEPWEPKHPYANNIAQTK
jgi:uncharacterized membrane protein YeiH